MITMGQLRKLLNVTLDNIQLSGNKLHKFLISDSGQDPMTKVIMEFGPSCAARQSGLHGAATLNLLEMTLECIEDSGGQLLTFLIEDNEENVMKVILEFQPKGTVRNSSSNLCDTCVPGSHGTFPLGSQKDHPRRDPDADYSRRHSIGSSHTDQLPTDEGRSRRSGVHAQIPNACANNSAISDTDTSSMGVSTASNNCKLSEQDMTLYTQGSSQTSDGSISSKTMVPVRDAHYAAIPDNTALDKHITLKKTVPVKDAHYPGIPEYKTASEKHHNDTSINPGRRTTDDLNTTNHQLISLSTEHISNDGSNNNVSTHCDQYTVSNDNNNTLKQRPLSNKLPPDFQAPLVRFKGGDIKLSGAKPPPLVPMATQADSSKTYKGAVTKSTATNHIGNGRISRVDDSYTQDDEDLTSEAQDTVCALPSIEKPKSPTIPRRRSSSPAAPGKGGDSSRSPPTTSRRRGSDAEDDDELDDDSDDSIELISEVKRPGRKKGVLVRRSTMFF